MKKNKHTITVICIASLLLTLLVLFLVYPIIDKKNARADQTREEYTADIASSGKLLLNGYLGVLFRFKHVGNTGWILLPLLVWFFLTREKRERWQKALVFSWLCTMIFLSIKGYTNFRYQLSLFPLTIVMTLYLLSLFLVQKPKWLKSLCYSTFALIVIFNLVNYFPAYRTTWQLQISQTDPHYPYKLEEFLDSLDKNQLVLTVNQPFFYYHTQGKGLDYSCPTAVPFLIQANKKKGSRDEVFRLFKDYIGGSYVLINVMHRRFARAVMMEEFLGVECTEVMEDNGRQLLRVRPRKLEEEITRPPYRHINPPQSIRLLESGIFSMETKPVRESKKETPRDSLTVTCTGMAKGKKTQLLFGYEFSPRSISEPIPSDQYVTFIVRASFSHTLTPQGNSILLSDYVEEQPKGKWEQLKNGFTTHVWRTYVLSKKIRPGASHVNLVFSFTPRAVGQHFRVKDIKIIVSKKPL